MSDYESWQAFAAAWGSLYCFLIFFAGCVYALLPSRKRAYDEAALIPLKDD
jgi:cbb3-type cytochrome oxidase subunit 3